MALPRSREMPSRKSSWVTDAVSPRESSQPCRRRASRVRRAGGAGSNRPPSRASPGACGPSSTGPARRIPRSPAGDRSNRASAHTRGAPDSGGRTGGRRRKRVRAGEAFSFTRRCPDGDHRNLRSVTLRSAGRSLWRMPFPADEERIEAAEAGLGLTPRQPPRKSRKERAGGGALGTSAPQQSAVSRGVARSTGSWTGKRGRWVRVAARLRRVCRP